MDNEKIAVLASLENQCVRNNLSLRENRLAKSIVALADKYAHNPAKQWVLERPWDGNFRFEQFCETLKVPDDYVSFRNIVLKRWTIGAIAAAFAEHGIKFEYVLVLVGPQGLGKTSWILKLAPKGLVIDGLTLDTRDKDSKIEALSHWIVEFGELDATFKRSDIAALKAFLSRQLDLIRLPYAPSASNFGRRTVFAASVNEDKFLADTTGNRRFWPIKVLAINYEHDFDMQQVFAEVYERFYLQGEKFYLSRDEEKLQQRLALNHGTPDPLAEKIAVSFDFTQGSKASGSADMTATQILEAIGIMNPNHGQATKVGSIMNNVFGLQSRKEEFGNVYRMPPRLFNFPSNTI